MKITSNIRLVKLLVVIFTLLTAQHATAEKWQPESFRVEVSGTGEDIILIPGLMSDASVWSSLSDVLIKDHRLHMISIAGFASMPKIENQSLSRVKQELFEYIEQHQLHKPTIIGHSLGGFMAFWMASSAPDKLGKIISIDGLPFIGPVFTGNNKATAESLSQQAAQMKVYYANMSATQLADQNRFAINRQATSDTNKQRVLAMADASHPNSVGEAVFTLMTTALRQAVSKINISTILLGAFGAFNSDKEKDYYANIYRQQLSAIKDAKLLINRDSRHFIMFDKPVWLAAQIESFLDKHK
ncbi:MAG: alpha/beta hydrolase [Kangiellaceae bacterium]|nr:alpha/beta hydrolase [Kangiellaceae bacterium]